ncbi:MAG: hypothetical protein NTY86_10625 [Deltaproteobacteria bacterium]|nr:hypothetical protein [Deltaproteobacteria bacterium]
MAKPKKEKGFILVIMLFLLLLLAVTAVSLNVKSGMQARMAANRTVDAQTYLDQLAVIEQSLWKLTGDPSWRVSAGEDYTYQGRTYNRKVFGPDKATYPALAAYNDTVIISVRSPNASTSVNKSFRYNIDTPFLIRKPWQVCLDSASNIFFADVDNHSIWKIDAITGAILRVAGTGMSGFSGDGGSATQARLDSPHGVCIDGMGNIYIADTNNNRIRKVAAGFISTVAGTGVGNYNGEGLATAAQINLPSGVAVDTSGNIYIADTSNHRIRKFTVGGNISTVAGTGVGNYNGEGLATAAQINLPSGVAVDASGNIYIADTNNHRIRKFTVGGNISTVAGISGVYGGPYPPLGDGGAATDAKLNGPNGVWADAAGNIFIADTGNNRIRKFTVGGNISTVAGISGSYSGPYPPLGDGGPATAARIDGPTGIAVKSTGEVIISDTNNSRLRQVSITNTISTLPMTVGPGLNSPQRIAAYYDSTYKRLLVFIADKNNHRIRMFDTATNVMVNVAGRGDLGFSGDNSPALNAQLNGPEGIAAYYDASQQKLFLYMADTGNNRIRKVEIATLPENINNIVIGNITPVAGGGTASENPDPTKVLLITPQGVFADSDGNVFIADTGSHKIRKINTSGDMTSVAGSGNFGFSGDGGTATTAKLTNPTQVFVDSGGNMYIADTGNHCIRKVNAIGNIITTVAGIGLSSGYSGDGGAATAAQLSNPRGVSADPAGNIYIADTGNHRLRIVNHDPIPVISTMAGTGTSGYNGDGQPAVQAQLSSPGGVALGLTKGGGRIFISDTGNNRVRMLFMKTVKEVYGP